MESLRIFFASTQTFGRVKNSACIFCIWGFFLDCKDQKLGLILIFSLVVYFWRIIITSTLWLFIVSFLLLFPTTLIRLHQRVFNNKQLLPKQLGFVSTQTISTQTISFIAQSSSCFDISSQLRLALWCRNSIMPSSNMNKTRKFDINPSDELLSWSPSFSIFRLVRFHRKLLWIPFHALYCLYYAVLRGGYVNRPFAKGYVSFSRKNSGL